MADGVFGVTVVTPEERLVDVRGRSVVLRSSDGDLTVLDGHTPLVTDVVPGEVRVEPEEGDTLHLAVHGGYLQVDTGPVPGAEGAAPVRSTRVTLLAGVAELRDKIDVARAERARDDAETRLEELRAAAGRAGGGAEGTPVAAAPSAEEAELALAEAALRRAQVRLEVAGTS